MAVNESQIRVSLERYGKAMSSGDLTGISSCWVVPAIVLADEGAVAVSDKDQIERFFAQVIEWYQSRGLMETRPEIERIDALTERLTSVDVRWPSFDEAGVERASERSHYVLRLCDDGQHRVQVAITEPRPTPD